VNTITPAPGRIAREYGSTLIDSIAGAGRALFSAVCKADLEGIVAKCRKDPFGSGTTWFKIRNRNYSQWAGREELFKLRETVGVRPVVTAQNTRPRPPAQTMA
jgi:ATP-dependent DNA ligase